MDRIPIDPMELDDILAKVRGMARKRCGRPPCELDELVSVGYCAVAEGLASHDPARGTLESRCVFLAWNRMTDYMRYEFLRLRHSAPLRDAGGYPRQFACIEAAHDLKRLMALRLTPQRMAVVAGRLAGKTHAEIAAGLRISRLASELSYQEAVRAMKQKEAA